jgi:hypothetical protein
MASQRGTGGFMDRIAVPPTGSRNSYVEVSTKVTFSAPTSAEPGAGCRGIALTRPWRYPARPGETEPSR